MFVMKPYFDFTLALMLAYSGPCHDEGSCVHWR